MAASAMLPLQQVIAGVIFGALAGLLSFRLKFLSRSGSLAAAILGAVIFSVGGLAWTIPLLAFFIPSSIISRIAQRLRPGIASEFEKSGSRDFLQVGANGGLGGCLAILSLIVPSSHVYELYLGGLAAVAADTWGTEVGILAKGKTILVTTFKPVAPGRSGGISAAGLIGGLFGAAIVAFSASWWTSDSIVRELLVLGSAGLLGSLVDSVLGASFQAQYVCVKCGTRTERKAHCSEPAGLAGGRRWMTNDLVNFLASIAGAAAAEAIGRVW